MHILRQGCFEFHHLVFCRVREFQAKSVQSDPAYDRFGHGGFSIGQLPPIDELAAVHIIGDDGVLYV